MSLIYLPELPVQWEWVDFEGPDAQDFLHRLSTANVTALAPGRGVPACFLNAQGKIIAFFWLWKLADQKFVFEFDIGPSGDMKRRLLEFIDKHTFGEKFSVTDRAANLEWKCQWVFTPPDREPANAQAFAEEGGIQVLHHGEKDYGYQWHTVWGLKAKVNDWVDKKYPHPSFVEFELLEDWRIPRLSPRVDTEITEDSNPLELGLVDAVARGKGCYPGQEVMEKIFTYGSPAKRLCLIEGKGTVAAGASVTTAGTTGTGADQGSATEVGKVTSVAAKPNQYQALAYLRKTAAVEGNEINVGPGHGKARIIKCASFS